ncbi:SUMF1/EgtB/PvdO family nonheme iron enzyme [Nocardia brasiliensis]|uniref:SUMF1/EgtB/PvdO family nonheme iron enzyme n=1 Tax=Nocardia brasiliensis TaxID=37326 RepID=A0A6G9XUB3_NOCBR|nr:SUMF1/EgtB/PvdO family nonheme iron enzyme [Nocardia brasiliensis]QIS04551.1 SUMF1/EgtB/PvdO family nonheme iron enzyme [Nocardia brasiliensis]
MPDLRVDPDALITVPAGTVRLADRRTQRSWTVDIATFRIGAVPITQERYALITGERPSSAPGERRPVDGVSWWDAVRCCNAMSERAGLRPAYRIGGDDDIEWDTTAAGYRLPSEAEWEYACRAGSTGPRYGPLDDIAWYRGNSDDRMHEVGGRRPNAFGLFDMLGNTWDWCWDVYDAEVYGAYRVLRGGGWFDEHWSCRAGVRRRSHPSLRLDDVGFRVARSITP